MNKLPWLLIVDDELGHDASLRGAFCEKFGLRERTVWPPEESESDDDAAVALADAWFHPGQKESGDRWVNDVEKVLEAVECGWPECGQRWALVLVDYQFRPGRRTASGGWQPERGESDDLRFGACIVEAIRKQWPFIQRFEEERKTYPADVPVVMLSAMPASEVDRATVAAGSIGFLPKGGDEPKRTLARLLFKHGLVEDRALKTVTPTGTVEYCHRVGHIRGRSLALLRALRTARLRVVPECPAPRVLVLGERGAGKGRFAQYMHDLSPRVDALCVRKSLDGLPETLIEAELFGVAEGAATDVKPRKGLLSRAEGGTLFLDEVANLGPHILRKLLLCLEKDGEFEEVGSNRPIRVQCQVVLATNKNVLEKIKKDEFPADLYDRMTGLFRVPPLRAWEDRGWLFRVFLEEACRAMGREEPFELSDEAAKWVLNHPWPGNVREMDMLALRLASKREFSTRIEQYDLEMERNLTPEEGGVQQITDFNSLVEAIAAFKFSRAAPPSENELQNAWPRVKCAVRKALVELLTTLTKTPGFRGTRGPLNVSEVGRVVFGLPNTSKLGQDSKNALKRELGWDDIPEDADKAVVQTLTQVLGPRPDDAGERPGADDTGTDEATSP